MTKFAKYLSFDALYPYSPENESGEDFSQAW